MYHCMKKVRIWSYSGPHFPPFGLNTERCGVSFRIQSKCGKIRIRITPNTDTFHRVYLMNAGLICQEVTNVITERLIGNSIFAVSSDLSNHIFKGRMSLTFELIYGKSYQWLSKNHVQWRASWIWRSRVNLKIVNFMEVQWFINLKQRKLQKLKNMLLDSRKIDIVTY